MIPTCLQMFINFFLSTPPVSYMVHVSVPKSFSIKMDGISLSTLFTLTWWVWLLQNGKHSHKYMDTELGEHWCRWHLPQYCCMQKMPPCTALCWEKRRRVQSYSIISRNNSNFMQLRRRRIHLGITREAFWNKTANVNQSDPPDFQTKMKKGDTAKSGLKIPKWTSTKTYTKTFTVKTSYASFVLILHEILIYSEWEEIKKRSLKRDFREKEFLSGNRVMWKLMWFY